MGTQFGTAVGGDGDSETVGEETARRALSTMEADRVDFCQVVAAPVHDYAELLGGIQSIIGEDTVVVGCSSGGAFTEDGSERGGVAVALVTSDELEFVSALATGLRADVGATVRAAARDLPLHVEDYPFLTAIAFYDGLVGAGEEIALETQRILGKHVAVAGGAAADDLRMDATHVFEGGRAVEDGIVLALVASSRPTASAASHGHEPISEPLAVTAAEGPVVRELDGRPAPGVWIETVRDHASEQYDIDCEARSETEVLRELATHYGFGIDQGDGYKIRWPGLTLGEETVDQLRFPVTIPEGTVFRITTAPVDAQRASVREAVAQARAELGETAVAGGFVYGCGSAMVPEIPDTIAAELDGPVAGFESYGQLCLERGQLSGHHNGTTVALLLPE